MSKRATLPQSSFLGFDPGARSCAWALYDGGRIVSAGFEKWEASEAPLVFAPEGARYVVIEVPQVYAQRKWSGDPNDLIAVAVTAGRIAQWARAYCESVRLVVPHAWKGSVPKRVLAERIMRALDADERRVVDWSATASQRHNVIDAVGLALWGAGREL